MKLFAQLTKVDEKKRLIYGIAAAEQPDRSGEILDYASSKANFEKWSQETKDATDGRSHGNLRAMHGNVAAGVLKSLECDDVTKSFPVCAEVVDDQEWKKVLKGVYTGFSIGGAYGNKWDDVSLKKEDGKPLVRYTAKPSEVSLVDRACIPAAKFFSIQKKDGAVEHVEFQLEESCLEKGGDGAVEYQVAGSDEQVAALAKIMHEETVDMGFVLGSVQKAVDAAKTVAKLQNETTLAAQFAADGTLRKGMYTLAELARICASLDNLRQSVDYEEAAKNDTDSVLPARLRGMVSMCCAVLSDMVAEECGETVGKAGKYFEVAAAPGDVPPAMRMMAKGDFFEALRKNTTPKLDRASRDKLIRDTVAAMGVVSTSEKTETDKGLVKVDLSDETLQKAISKQIDDALSKREEIHKIEMAVVTEQLAKLAAQPAAPKAILRAVSKGADGNELGAKDTLVTPILKSDGGVNDVATLIKAQHQTGGRPFFG